MTTEPYPLTTTYEPFLYEMNITSLESFTTYTVILTTSSFGEYEKVSYHTLNPKTMNLENENLN
jgi:hypothetical protein